MGRLFDWLAKHPGPEPAATAAAAVLVVSDRGFSVHLLRCCHASTEDQRSVSGWSFSYEELGVDIFDSRVATEAIVLHYLFGCQRAIQTNNRSLGRSCPERSS